METSYAHGIQSASKHGKSNVLLGKMISCWLNLMTCSLGRHTCKRAFKCLKYELMGTQGAYITIRITCQRMLTAFESCSRI